MDIKGKPLKATTFRGRKKVGEVMSPPHEKDLKPSLMLEQANRQTNLDDFTQDKIETLTTAKLLSATKRRHPKAKKEEVSAEELVAVKAQLGDKAVEAHHPEGAQQQPKKKPKRISATKRKVIEAAVNERDERKPTGYIHPCIWKFPHRDPGKEADGRRVTIWDVGDDRLKLRIQADPDYGIPYGVTARLILALAMRSAIILKDRELNLGKCQKAFLEELGQGNDGRRIRMLKEQMRRLFFSIMTIEQNVEKMRTYDRVLLFEYGSGELDYWQGKEGAKWPSTLIMSEKFFQAAQETPVPIQLQCIQALGKSPLAVDVYLWLSYRMYRLRRSGRPFVKIPWTELQREFGAGYPETPQGKRNFKKKFCGALKAVIVVYSQAQGHVHTDDSNYLRLTPAPVATHLKSAP